MFAQRRYPSHLHSPIVLVRKNPVDLWRSLLTVAGDDDGRHRHGGMVEFRATVQTGSDYTAFGPSRFGRRHYVSPVDRVAALVSTEQL
jgi:hypothetical protein